MKFTETGEVVLRVSCENRDETSVVLRLTVCDSGIGVAPDRLDARLDSGRFKTTAPTKMATGMTILGLGFLVLYAGQMSAKRSTASVGIAISERCSLRCISTSGASCRCVSSHSGRNSAKT